MAFSAIIFDMDGLLVDSEPLWYEVETHLIESSGYIYDDDVRESTIGLRVDEFAHIIHRHYPKVASSPNGVSDAVLKLMVNLPREKIKARPGAEEIIHYVADLDIPRAIASSSSQIIIEHFVSLLGWSDLIPLRYSAEFMERGKPAPDIYLHTAQQLGIEPQHCLALEDSRAGTMAALSAGMTCFSIPDLSHGSMNDFDGINDHVFASLHDVLDEFIKKRLFS